MEVFLLVLRSANISATDIERPNGLESITLLRLPLSATSLLKVRPTEGVPKEETKAHENDETPKAHEDSEHYTFFPQRGGIRVDETTNETFIITISSSNCSLSNRLRNFVN